MKIKFLWIFFLLINTVCISQNKTIVFESSDSKYYSKTDFSKIDSLQLWKYKILETAEGFPNDSIKPIGTIIFGRIKPITDSISEKVYLKKNYPMIEFEVFNKSDLKYVINQSNKTRFFSSCISPDVGGDVIILENFILINRHVCLQCNNHTTKVDYCRPIINFIFSQIKNYKSKSIRELSKQFVIDEFKEKVGH